MGKYLSRKHKYISCNYDCCCFSQNCKKGLNDLINYPFVFFHSVAEAGFHRLHNKYTPGTDSHTLNHYGNVIAKWNQISLFMTHLHCSSESS